MVRAALIAGASLPVTTRVAVRRYTLIHVAPAGPAGTSRAAAAVRAAYATLVQLYPTQTSTGSAGQNVPSQLTDENARRTGIDLAG